MFVSSFRFLTSLTIGLLATLVICQSCYYPNGNFAADDLPCSPSGDGPCCPLNWQCLSNGLCYLENANYFERHTCTDQKWQSAACPNFCTQNSTAGGNEAVLQCSPGQYCCDGNRSKNCCIALNVRLFGLPNGNPATTIGITAATAPSSTDRPSPNSQSMATPSSNTPTSSAPSASNANIIESSSTFRAISSNSLAASISPSTTSTSSASNISAVILTVETVITSNSQGVQTVYVINTPTSSPVDTSTTHLGIVLGCAISIPVSTAAISLGALLLLIHRRRRHRRNEVHDAPSKEKDGVPADSPMPALPQPDADALGPCTSEIYGKPVHSHSGDRGISEVEGSLSLGRTGLLLAYSPRMASKQWRQPAGGYRPYRPVYELPG